MVSEMGSECLGSAGVGPRRYNLAGWSPAESTEPTESTESAESTSLVV